MDEPICLIENKPDEKLQVNPEALSILQSIQQPVVVVAIVGLYRTGKSYLMNKLAGKDKGFSLGSTIQAETTGIWMWCRPHPEKPGHTLVLLDTEGLGDVEKSNIENDSWIFALSILLSSTFVYNSMGTIDQFALEKLQYVTELTKRIKNQLQAKLLELCAHNQQASSERCQALLAELFQGLEEKIGAGCYSMPGGYQQFLDDQREKLEQYEREPGKGIMAPKALQDFLKSQEPTVQSILQADLNLTEQQKKTEGKPWEGGFLEQIRADNAQREAELQKQMKDETVRMAQEQQRSYEEHKIQLINKMEEDRRKLMEEHERVMNQKLAAQSGLLRTVQDFPPAWASLHAGSSPRSRGMADPIWLVEPSLVSGILRVNPKALSLLGSLVGRLHVVAVFGPKGTGKSFLMNQLAGEGEGFGPSPGISLRCQPHSERPGDILVLLDTEGLPEEMEEDVKTMFLKLFLLDVLLSNVFLYNTTSEGDVQKELDRLTIPYRYVTELSDKVRVLEDCSPEDGFLLDSFLPEFVWCLRDVVSDSYWEDMLQATDNDMDTILPSSTTLKDTPTSCIQKLFPSRKAFCFRSPHVGEEDGEIFTPGDPHPVFQNQLGSFKDYIFSKSPKSSLGNTFVTGKAQAIIMEEPICLIENTLGKELQVNQEALRLLQSIQQPLVVVAIVGLYRTGKSYLMNKLAGKDKGGFSLGATVQANTKGIWMWCRPHPCKPGHTLVLLDTEGLGDVEKSNTKNDTWIFALSVLLSSTFIYNSMSTIDYNALNSLRYLYTRTLASGTRDSGKGLQDTLLVRAGDFQSHPEVPSSWPFETLQLRPSSGGLQILKSVDPGLWRSPQYSLHLKLKELCHQNEQASLDRCQAVLLELSEELEEKIHRGSYTVPGGHQQFLDDQRRVVEQYHRLSDKGLMAFQALQEFLKSKEATAQSILQSDKTLTKQQKLVEAERVRAEASEREAQLQRQMREQAEQVARDKERSYREHEQQLRDRMEEDRKRAVAQYETMLQQKLQEQRRLQEEGLQKEVARLEAEIRNLQHQANQPRKSSSSCVIS
ncbi:hypothetical protein lerEdw1_009961 [Lerista edwardsae]|nr:hypothetical protein lerEdw1_009961 [Lerista edwardsae]